MTDTYERNGSTHHYSNIECQMVSQYLRAKTKALREAEGRRIYVDLTIKDKDDIKQAHRSGTSMAKLSRQHNIGHRVIQRVCREDD